jgi:putative transposase
LVDTLGLLTAWFVHPADESDSEGGYDVVERAEPDTGRVGKLWTDSAYRGEFAEWVEGKYGWAVEVVTRAAATVGFVVQPHRWLVERTFGGLGRCRRLSKDYEEYPESSESWMALAMSHLLIRRLASAT